MIDFTELSKPFPGGEIEWRVGSTTADKSKGMALAYIDARAVMDRLDAVCGPENWQCRYPHANSKTCAEIGILVGDQWVWKSDGAGDTDFEGAKGGFSDSFKRAAVRWGIGRYLYHLKAPWVAIEQKGRSYVIAPHEMNGLKALAAKANNEPAPKVDTPPKSENTNEFRAKVKALADDINACTAEKDPEMLAGILRGHGKTIAAIKNEAPKWWMGSGPEHPPGFKDRLEALAKVCGVTVDLDEVRITG